MLPPCFLVEDGSITGAAIQHILSAVAGELQHDGKEPLLHLRFSSSSLKYPTVMERALQICRQHGELSKWNTLHLGEADALRAIQLCIGERMKQECGEFCAQASDVLAVHQRLNNNAIYGDAGTSTNTSSAGGDSSLGGGGGDPDTAAYQRYLSSSHLVDGPAVLRALRRLWEAAGEGTPDWRRPTVVHGRPAGLLERSVAALLTGDEPVAVRRTEASEGTEKAQEEAGEKQEDAGVEPESKTEQIQERESGEEEKPGTEECREEALTGQEETAEGQAKEPGVELELVRTVWHCVDVTPADGAAGASSPTDAHIRNMFGAMFRLLVNSRDELALAAACQAPGLELAGPDFLAIRRTARSRDLPMYQTVVSHVRRVELGGANYQPPADCPLHGCTPPLRALVRLLHKLHDLLEEEPDPSKCCFRLLSAMRACVSRGSRLRQSAVERVAAELKDTVKEVAADCEGVTDSTVVGGPSVQLVRQMCDRLSCASAPVTDHLSVLEDTVTSPGTPGRRPATLPSVVSLFRTPPEVDGEESNDGVGLSLEERLRRKGITRTGETPTTSKRCGASLGWLPTGDAPAGGASPVHPDPTPPLVAGPTLVCSRSGTKYAAGEGVRAFRDLQAADRARQQEGQIVSPKSSRAPKKPKRSLFEGTGSAKRGASKPKGDTAKSKSGGNKSAAKKRKTEAAQDQENSSATDTSEREPGQQLQKGKAQTIEENEEDGSDGIKPAAKKRKTEAAHDQENLPASDVLNSKSRQQTQQPKAQAAGQKKARGKQIRQVTGQKSIRDFFRI